MIVFYIQKKVVASLFHLAWLLGRLLPLYFPRDKHEEEIAATKLPSDVGDENGETVISERKIRISALPGIDGSPTSIIPVSGDVTPTYRSTAIKRWIFGAHNLERDEPHNLCDVGSILYYRTSYYDTVCIILIP